MGVGQVPCAIGGFPYVIGGRSGPFGIDLRWAVNQVSHTGRARTGQPHVADAPGLPLQTSD